MTVSYIFKYYDTLIWDEYLDDDDDLFNFASWLHMKKVPKALSVYSREYGCEITFKKEKDLIFFLLTL